MNERHDIPTRWTIRNILQWTARYFSQKGVAAPRLDAEVLLAHALGVDRLFLYLNLDQPLPGPERARYRTLAARRAGREPVALITGTKEFWSIPFKISRGVLIPRPDTETLVQAVLDHAANLPAPRILEIGTGSGCVATATAHEKQDARITATDVSLVALSLAAENLKAAGVSNCVRLLCCDIFDALRPGPNFELICSNPPYVPSGVIPTLEPEAARFEPELALDGGPDGLDVIRRVAARAGDFLKEGGALILEIGDGQEESVERILADAGFRAPRIFKDLAGRPRVVRGLK
jgi:release factor glutamine methyltransferase